MGDGIRVTVTVKSSPSPSSTPDPVPSLSAPPTAVVRPAPNPPPALHHPQSSLPFTGAPLALFVLVAVVLLAIGLTLNTAASRRLRRRRQEVT